MSAHRPTNAGTCTDDCGAASGEHCWNGSLWAEPVKAPGALVTFLHGTRPCVGYIDSIDPVVAGFAANVTAVIVKPGTWNATGNAGIGSGSWRVPLADLTVLLPARAA